MSKEDTIVRFDDVSFEYGVNKPILQEVSFGVRRGAKITIMGQNGAGKSTIFGLITGLHTPDDGYIHILNKATIAISRQVIQRPDLDLTVRNFFAKCFDSSLSIRERGGVRGNILVRGVMFFKE